MKLTQDQATEILKMDLETAYKTYLIMCIEELELKEELPNIKYGIKIEFDIRDHFTKKNKHLQKKDKVLLRDRRLVPLSEYRDELEERETMMKKIMLDHLTDDEIVEGR